MFEFLLIDNITIFISGSKDKFYFEIFPTILFTAGILEVYNAETL